MCMVSLIEHYKKAIPIFALSAKIYIECYSDGRWHHSDQPIPDTFHPLISLISPIRSSTYLNSMSDFVGGVCNLWCFSNATRYTESPFSDADRHD